MAWELRTTEASDFLPALTEVTSGKRSFIWFTAHNQKERSRMVTVCRAADLEVLNIVPVWFVLACPRRVNSDDRERMARSILRGAGSEEARWRGRMFGYPTEDIDWYVTEVEAAWKRFHDWRVNNG